MEQQIGESSRIGPYVLDAPIGKGGFATIWRGHHESTNQPVAVKILGNDVTGSYRAVQRAEIELLAAAAVRRTKHAVQVLDGGIQPFPHLVMEFVNGVDFAEVLRREGRLSIERTIEVAIAVADALSAMNEAGIIHRDLKPANVMLDGDGVIKLTDFGIAKIIGYETITAAGEIALTMAYAAPEVWDTDGPYGAPGHRSDLYALAIMLFEFLTGSTPFSGNYTTLYRSHRERRPDLTKLPGETPASLRLLLERCLEKNPDDRPRDADVCLKMLRRAEVELQESRGEKPRSEPQRFGPWERLRPHPTQPWAWLCRREEGDIATVELHFDTVAETGNRLRKAVAASAALAPLGAERLLETNRQLLRPGEDWTEPPPGGFQFWVARREVPALSAAEDISRSELGVIAAGLLRLIATARANGIGLSFSRADVTVAPGGRLQIRRPGIDAPQAPMEEAALAFVAKLPLDANARALVVVAGGLESLTSGSSPFRPEAATQVIGGFNAAPRVVAGQVRGELCAGCGSVLTVTDAFCGSCGRPNRPLESPKCPRCAAAVAAVDAFCGNCGQRLGG